MELIEHIINSKRFLLLIPSLSGFIVWKRLNSEYKLLVFVLLYAFVNEVIKFCSFKYLNFSSSVILSNIFNVINFNFLFWLFFIKTHSKIFKKIINVIVIAYILSLFIESFFLEKDYFRETQVIPYLIGAFGILICTSNYFIQILLSSQKENPFKNLMFWVAIAYFIYFLGFIPFKVVENDFLQIKEYQDQFYIKKIIVNFKDVILAIGFIWSHQKSKL